MDGTENESYRSSLHLLTRRPSVSDRVRNDDDHCYADKKRVSCGGSRSSDSGCDVIVVTNWWLLFIWKYNKQNEFSGPRAPF